MMSKKDIFKFGTIVLIPFPFTDLTSTKLRPALIISKTDPRNEDIIVCFISSKIENRTKNGFILKMNDQKLQRTGLKTTSLVRFDKIATLNKKLIIGELGHLPSDIISKMKKPFLETFGF